MRTSDVQKHPVTAAPFAAWDDVRFFIEVARQGSLSGAARTLGVEHSTAARRIAALESGIGLRLFDRLATRWRLTPQGEALLPAARRIEAEALAFGRAAASATAAGATVRVSAPPMFASHFLVPQLATRFDRWQDIRLEIVGEVRFADHQRREADLALRFMRPTETGLAGRKLGELDFRVYATADWLGRPESAWRFVGYNEPLTDVPHQKALAAFAGSRPFVLRSNNLGALHSACRSGLGLAMLPGFLAHGDERLVEVPCAPSATRELWSVVHPDVRRDPRVKRIKDLIAELLAETREDGAGQAI